MRVSEWGVGVEILWKIGHRRGEVKTGKSSPGLEQSVLARRHETRVDRVKLQGERKGETEEEKGEEQWHDDWEINRAIEQEVNTCTQPQEVAKRVLAGVCVCVGVCADVWGRDVVAATSIISITKREFHPVMENTHRCEREGMLTERFHTLFSLLFIWSAVSSPKKLCVNTGVSRCVGESHTALCIN